MVKKIKSNYKYLIVVIILTLLSISTLYQNLTDSVWFSSRISNFILCTIIIIICLVMSFFIRKAFKEKWQTHNMFLCICDSYKDVQEKTKKISKYSRL